MIVGVEFTGLSGMHKSAPPPAMEPGEAGEAGWARSTIKR